MPTSDIHENFWVEAVLSWMEHGNDNDNKILWRKKPKSLHKNKSDEERLNVWITIIKMLLNC